MLLRMRLLKPPQLVATKECFIPEDLKSLYFEHDKVH